jgi:hypothetical protein
MNCWALGNRNLLGFGKPHLGWVYQEVNGMDVGKVFLTTLVEDAIPNRAPEGVVVTSADVKIVTPQVLPKALAPDIHL